MPTDFSFLQVMDWYFKLHHVLNIHYNPALKKMIQFIEYFVYKNQNAEISMTIKVQKMRDTLFDN